MRITASRIPVAIGLFVTWMVVTWALEGRIETFLRPDAVFDRVLYAVVANLLIGVVGATCAIRWLWRTGAIRLLDAGFGPASRTVAAVICGATLGFALYVAQGAPSLNLVVIFNAYLQVLVVSTAEILVCWSVVATVVDARLRHRGRLIAIVVGSGCASALFGLYHYAHSAPFNTIGMVALLTLVGLATSIFFFVSQDVYGTIVFHNFLGTYGVVHALKASAVLDSFTTLQIPLMTMAIVTTAALIAADRFWLRRAEAAAPSWPPA